MLSRRVPRLDRPNRWWLGLAERRRAGARLLDLTESNPTRVGLGGDAAPGTGSAAAAGAGPYQPDPRGEPEARAAVAAYLVARGTAVAPEAIVLTTGTSESYAHLFRLLADPGDRVL